VPEHPGPRRATPLRELFAGLGAVVRDAAFWRIALCVGANQCAVLALFTLWITTWLRDVAGYDRAAAAGTLAWVAVALSAGYLFFGRLADARARKGRSTLPLLAGGVAASLACLALITLGVTSGAAFLWMACILRNCSSVARNPQLCPSPSVFCMSVNGTTPSWMRCGAGWPLISVAMTT